MRKRKPRYQVTCWCRAYSFPHRIGGGRCSGSAWAGEYLIYVRQECDLCNCLRGSECDVANGAEDIKYCEGMVDQLRTQENVRLPMTEEAREEHYMSKCPHDSR